MLFDRFLGLAEHHLLHPLHDALVRKARLFWYPGYPHETLPKEYTPDQIESLQEMFLLPFPVVAMEDPASCVILVSCHDLMPVLKSIPQNPLSADFLDQLEERWKQEYSKGINRPFISLELVPLDKFDPRAYRDGPDASKTQPDFDLPINSAIIMGEIRNSELTDHGANFEFSPSGMWGVPNAREPVQDIFDQFKDNEMLGNAGRNVMTALEEIMFFQAPDRFIVETMNLHVKPAKKGHLPRSHQRPQYISLRPPEIRDRISQGGTHASPYVHERRAHSRKLRSDYYKNKKGQVIWVPAVWVGKSEGGDSKRWYKVLLDK